MARVRYLKYSFFFKKTVVYTASGLYCIERVRYPEWYFIYTGPLQNFGPSSGPVEC